MSATLVSVIIPLYNGAFFIGQAISSVLAQTHQPLQIIVVDDGSTDASAACVREFGAHVQYLYQHNQGTGAARNTGLRHALGDYVAFLDQDDVWLPDKLTYQTSRLSEVNRLEAVFGHVEEFHDPPLPADSKTSRVRVIAGYLPSALLIRRSSLERVGLFETESQLVEWADWYGRAVEAQLQMEMPSRIVARRRIHPGNKGILYRDARTEYAKIIRASLARRRARN